MTEEENFESIFDILNRDTGKLQSSSIQSSPQLKICCHICFKTKEEKSNRRFLKWSISVLSDDESEADDDIEIEWSKCDRCKRWYHKDSLAASVGP